MKKGLEKMKVLLLKDVFKLGRAGDVKRVADGYGRNYLMPQGLAVLATPGALKQVERIKVQATIQRDALNEELGAVAEQLNGTVLTFTARASETGKLYGSITTQMIAESITEKIGVEINRRQVYSQPLRILGEHKVEVRLTVDLVPEVMVIINSEGDEQESPEVLLDDEPVAEVIEEEVLDEEEQESLEVPLDDEPIAEVIEEEVLDEEEQESPEVPLDVEPVAEVIEEEALEEEEQESPGEDDELETEVQVVEESVEE
jgi:large subunit ribosomal protein L9